MGDLKDKGEGDFKVESRSSEVYVELGIPEVEKVFAAQKFTPLKTNLYHRMTMFPEENNMVKEDRISQLPDGILEFIISLLPMRQGAFTCVLSQRWKNLWRTSASCLDLTPSTVFGNQYPKDMFQDKSTNVLYKEGRVFTRGVNKLFKSRHALRLDALRIFFPLDSESGSHIDRWLKFAASQKITELNLNFDFSYFRLPYHHDKAYNFPTQFFTQNHGCSLRYLRLKYCILELPPNCKGFNSLVSLAIENMSFTNSDVENILSNCPSLESLSLKIYINSKSLKFSKPLSPVLKHISYHALNASEVEVHDINILSFEVDFQFPHSILSIKNAPNLARLHLSGDVPVKMICDVHPPFEILLFSLLDWETDWFKVFEFKNLKQLVLDATVMYSEINLLDVIYILEDCLLLQKLELNMGTSIETAENLEKIKAKPRGQHQNLKEVNISGFKGHSTIIEFVKYLLKNAVVLQKMRISTKQKHLLSNGLWRYCERRQEGETKDGGISLAEVHKIFQKEVRTTTKLVICSYE